MHDASISGSSINNGRTMALSSQLAAISSLRRKAGRVDLSFPQEAIPRYQAARSLAEIFQLGCQDLTPAEIEHLEIAIAGKLLELADYRPYELQLTDCSFIRAALRKTMCSANLENQAELTRLVLRAAARLLNKGLVREAFVLVPTSHYSKAMARMVTRFASGRFHIRINPYLY